MYNLPDLITKLNLDLTEYFDYYNGCCPIHNGDNPTGFSLYKNGIWKCWTRGCEDIYGNNLTGLVKGVLTSRGENSNIEEIQINTDVVHKKKIKEKIQYIPEYYRTLVRIPSEYYIKRGYSEHILKKYDIGDCIAEHHAMFNRAIVPIFDINHTTIIGLSGRSIHNKCPLCRCYHKFGLPCPKISQRQYRAKWRHSSSFDKSQLYNLWFAKNFIKESQHLIIVESPGNVWRLEEAGFYNSIAIYGTWLSSAQSNIIRAMSIKDVTILLDNDDAGDEGTEKIISQLSAMNLNINIPQLSKNDIGDMSTLEIRGLLK